MKQLESLEFVVRNSRHVQINEEQVRGLAKNFAGLNSGHWIESSSLARSSLNYQQKTAFLFVFNAVSFSYWGNPKWTIEYENQTYNRGTWSLIAAIQRAMKENIPILDSSYLVDLSVEELGHILKGNVEIPLLEERTAILREVGLIVTKKYNGNFLQVISNPNSNSVGDLVDKIVGEFPSFNDSSSYNGEKVYFHKRAQLLVSDLNHSLGLGLDIHKLTACADYIIPMVLRYLGILEYDSALASKVDHQIEIQKDGEEENEIRAGTIVAIEQIKKELSKPNLTSMQLNDYFWLAGDTIPETEFYHLTRTTAY